MSHQTDESQEDVQQQQLAEVEQDDFYLDNTGTSLSSRNSRFQSLDQFSQPFDRPPMPLPSMGPSNDKPALFSEHKNEPSAQINSFTVDDLTLNTSRSSTIRNRGGRSEEDAAKGILYLPWSRPPIARHK
eukprot:gene7873-9981_t